MTAKRNRLRQTISIVVAFAMTLQTFLASDVMAFIMASGSDDFRTITICTGYGYKQITLDAENNPVTSLPVTKLETCPACVLVSGNALPALPASSGDRYDADTGKIAAFYHHQIPADCQLSPIRHSRAPPLLARA